MCQKGGQWELQSLFHKAGQLRSSSCMNRKPYPSDLTDDQWVLLEPASRRFPGLVAVPARLTSVRSSTPCSTATARAAPGEPCPTTSPPGRPSTTTPAGGSGTAPGRGCSQQLRQQVRVAAGREPTPRVAVIDKPVGQGDSGRWAATAMTGTQEAHRPQAAHRRGYAGAAAGRHRHGGKRRRCGGGAGRAEAIAEAVVPPPGGGAGRTAAYGKYGLPGWVRRFKHFVLELVRRSPPRRWAGCCCPSGALGGGEGRSPGWGSIGIHSRDYERLTESSETQVYIKLRFTSWLRRAAGVRSKYPYRYKREAQNGGDLNSLWNRLATAGS